MLVASHSRSPPCNESTFENQANFMPPQSKEETQLASPCNPDVTDKMLFRFVWSWLRDSIRFDSIPPMWCVLLQKKMKREKKPNWKQSGLGEAPEPKGKEKVFQSTDKAASQPSPDAWWPVFLSNPTQVFPQSSAKAEKKEKGALIWSSSNTFR
jgi:hypothetical protein